MLVRVDELPQDINILFRLKVNEFKRLKVKDISVNDLKKYMHNVKWRNEVEIEYCDAIDDIMSTAYSDVFEYLKSLSIIQARDLNLDDFKELLAK